MTYKTKSGDTVDLIAYQQYGASSNQYVSLILSANPGLADYGPVLDAGIAVSIPDISASQAASDSGVVKLWD